MPGIASVCAISFALVLAWSQAGPSTAAGTSAQLDGAWTGVYESYPYFIRISLQMPAGGRGSAELRLEPLVKLNTVVRAPIGVVPASIAFDPVARTLAITPGPEAYRVIGMPLPRFVGVLNEESQEVGGVVVGGGPEASPFFVLGRSPAVEKTFLSTLTEVMVEAAGGAALAQGRQNPQRGTRPAAGQAPSPEKIREWTARFVAEYPGVDPYRTEMGRAFLMARNLFRDDFFRPYFGAAYDDLSRADLQATSLELRKIPPPRSNFPEERPNSVARTIERAFLPTGGTYAWTDITLSVIAMRPMEAWRSQSLRRLAAAQGPGDVLKVVAALEAAENTVLATFWPSERKAFSEAVTAARRKSQARSPSVPMVPTTRGAVAVWSGSATGRSTVTVVP